MPAVPSPGGVGDRAGGDDRALAGHEARHRGDGADAARVGEGDGGAAQLVGAELVLSAVRILSCFPINL
ncbi:MAG: hypothetical protein QM706_08635, partial [Nitrospira sp.]